MSEKSRNRYSYSAEFKSEAVSKCKEIGVGPTSEELGVSRPTLKNWMISHELNNRSTDAGKPSYDELEKELKRLRKELGYMSEINRVLKKAQPSSPPKRWEI